MPMFRPKTQPFEARKFTGLFDPDLDAWITVEHGWIQASARTRLWLVRADGSRVFADATDWVRQLRQAPPPGEFDVVTDAVIQSEFEQVGAP